MSKTKFHTHTKQKVKIMVLYILIFKFLNSRRIAKDPEVDGSQYSLHLITQHNRKYQRTIYLHFLFVQILLLSTYTHTHEKRINYRSKNKISFQIQVACC